jgi:hypothetical protein
MDLCHSKGFPHREQRRAEFFKAFRVLEDTKNQSKMAAKLIASMMHILQKNKITPPKVSPSACLHGADASHPLAPPIARSSASEMYSAPGLPTPEALPRPMEIDGNYGGHTVDGFLPKEVDLSYFPDLVQSLDQGMNFDTFNWNDIFVDLESSFAGENISWT